MLENATVSLPTLVLVVISAVTWAGSAGSIYFSLRSRIAMGESRMDRFRTELDAGSSKFAGLEARQAHHSERLIVNETLLSAMNDKLDTILTALKDQNK